MPRAGQCHLSQQEGGKNRRSPGTAATQPSQRLQRRDCTEKAQDVRDDVMDEAI